MAGIGKNYLFRFGWLDILRTRPGLASVRIRARSFALASTKLVYRVLACYACPFERSPAICSPLDPILNISFLERRRIQEPHCDNRGAQHDQRADKEHRAQAGPAGDQTQRRVGESQRQVEKSGVSSHGQPAALRWRAVDRFHSKAGVNQWVAEAGDRRPEQRQCGPRG